MEDCITHASKHVRTVLIGEKIKFPTDVHTAYCGAEIRNSEVDNDNPSCEACQDWLTWNEIDSKETK